MDIIKATSADAHLIHSIISFAIKECYPKYYPDFAVEFFLYWHSLERISKRLESENIFIMYDNETAVAVGGYNENHLYGLYVLPEFQGKGFGGAFMDFLENKISREHSEVVLDSSLSACIMYEKRGYRTVKHGVEKLAKGFLVYEIMEKKLKEV